jgi:hypothetical protein
VDRDPSPTVRCAHDGYHRLPGRPEHERRWTFAGRTLVVEDRVGGRFRTAEARYHLHPDVRIEEAGSIASGTELALLLPGGGRAHVRAAAGGVRVEPATWHPRFGESVPTRCLVVPLVDARARIEISWEQTA